MMRWLEMPLLGKELTELAAKKRTWVFRVLAVLGVMLAFLAGWVDIMLSSDGFQRPGVGREIFEFMVGGLFGALFVFIPLAMCGTLAGERERGTLDILLLTHQSPWRIIWQKYLGNLVPFFTVLLAALPMMAICYAMGGLSQSDITVAAVLLIVTCLQLGALTMVGSALCRSTAMAFFTSLAVGFFYYCVPQVVAEVWNELTPGYIRPDFALGFWFLPQNHFSGQGTCHWGFVTVPVTVSWIPAAMTVPLLLGVARFFLERDAQAQVVRLVRAFLARQQKRIRPSIKSGVRKIFGRFKPSSLPEDEPIAWRETSRVFYGRKDVMVGLAIVFALVVLGIMGIGLLDAIYGGRHWQRVTLSDLIQLHIDELVIMEAWIWGIGAGLLLIRGVTAFLTDRMRQSLPVLMITPMTGREIVLQKVKAMHGLMCALAVPLAIVMSVRILWCGASIGLVYLLSLSATTCILIYGPMFAWIGFWMGLRCRNFLVAMTVTTTVVGLWFFLPLACWVVFIFGYSGTPGEIAAALISLISPAAWVIVLLVGDHEGVTAGQFLIGTFVNTMIHGTILCLVRRHVLRNADRWLGRAS